MSNLARLILVLALLALATPAVAGENHDLDRARNSTPQTTEVIGADGQIWLVTYRDLDGSGTFNDRNEFISVVLLRPPQR